MQGWSNQPSWNFQGLLHCVSCLLCRIRLRKTRFSRDSVPASMRTRRVDFYLPSDENLISKWGFARRGVRQQRNRGKRDVWPIKPLLLACRVICSRSRLFDPVEVCTRCKKITGRYTWGVNESPVVLYTFHSHVASRGRMMWGRCSHKAMDKRFSQKKTHEQTMWTYDVERN